jgi:hypothetical protein
MFLNHNWSDHISFSFSVEVRKSTADTQNKRLKTDQNIFVLILMCLKQDILLMSFIAFKRA